MATGKPPVRAEPEPGLNLLIGRDGVREVRIFQCVGTEMKWDVESQFDYFGARYYDARIGRFLSADPLAGSPGLTRWSPYHYSYDNPLSFLDPTGLAPEVFINGDAAEEATEQIQRSTSLSISRDGTTGKLSASGEAKTDADKALLTAINDKGNDVRINATTANQAPSGDDLVIGHADAVAVEQGRGVADMTYNPRHAVQAQEYSGDPGQNAIHEVLEGHAAAGAAHQHVAREYGPQASSTFSPGEQSRFFGVGHKAVGMVLPLPEVAKSVTEDVDKRVTQIGVYPKATPAARTIVLFEKPW